MSSTTTKVVAMRLENEIAEYFSDKNLKEIVERIYRNGDTLSEIEDICFVHGINENALIKNVHWLFDAGKLFVKEGRLRWNKDAMNDEYISIDDMIDSMNVSEGEKYRIKKYIADNLYSMSGRDDTGNGAGV